ncbi:MAG TPA: hypothetical protein VNJ28_08300, partial [Candidatus Limnocylindrales bacterium]|nr:hypothetical protein [Candidatus Limnocylindrales bacterium]
PAVDRPGVGGHVPGGGPPGRPVPAHRLPGPAADRPEASRVWRIAFRAFYRLLRLLDPLVRVWWGAFGLGNVVDLEVPGRRTGRTRRVLVGLLRSGGDWFVGHPNGPAAWTRNLEAAGEAVLVVRPGRRRRVRAELLGPGPDRDRAIAATRQHPFPGNVIYRLARWHIRAAGFYFRLVPEPDERG